MGIVLDVILIVIILLNVIICYKKGLVKLAVGLVAVIVSLILAMILYKPVTNIIIKNTEIDEKILADLLVNVMLFVFGVFSFCDMCMYYIY